MNLKDILSLLGSLASIYAIYLYFEDKKKTESSINK